MKQLLAILAVLAVLAGCSLGGGANASRVVSGQVMVPDSGYWSSIKLGIFSGGTAGSYTALDTTDNFLGVADYRVYYSTGGSGAAPITPVAGTLWSITGTGDTLRDYTFELPAAMPLEDEYYFYAAWYDGNANSILDLVDSATPATIQTGEYNRCATKTENTESGPVLTVIDDFRTSVSGGYKYTSHGTGYSNIGTDLDTSNNSGFDFEISGSSGW